jgi:hypothetical protein
MPRRKHNRPILQRQERKTEALVMRFTSDHALIVEELAYRLGGSKADILRSALVYWLAHCPELQPILKEIPTPFERAHARAATHGE